MNADQQSLEPSRGQEQACAIHGIISCCEIFETLVLFNIEGGDNIGTRSCHFSEACECEYDVNQQQFERHRCGLEWPIILLIELCGQSFHPRSLTVCIPCVNRFPRLGPQRTTRKMSNF